MARQTEFLDLYARSGLKSLAEAGRICKLSRAQMTRISSGQSDISEASLELFRNWMARRESTSPQESIPPDELAERVYELHERNPDNYRALSRIVGLMSKDSYVKGEPAKPASSEPIVEDAMGGAPAAMREALSPAPESSRSPATDAPSAGKPPPAPDAARAKKLKPGSPKRVPK